MEKAITIDKLAQMVQGQFNEIDKRFDCIDEALVGLGGGQDSLLAGQQRILDILLEIPSKKVFERLDDKIQTLDIRLASVERKVK